MLSENYSEMTLFMELPKDYATSNNYRIFEYTASGEFWTYYHKLDGNYIIDANFPLVAFFID